MTFPTWPASPIKRRISSGSELFVNLATKKEESTDNDSSNKEDKTAPKEVAEKKGSKLAAQTEENSSDKSRNEDNEPTPKK